MIRTDLSGFKLASFIIGFAFVIAGVTVATNKLFDNFTPQTVTVKEELPASTVDLFRVDYNQYGNYKIESNILLCGIFNNGVNLSDCTVYLEDNEGVISELKVIQSGNRVLTLNMVKEYTTKGKYPVKLV